MDVHKLAKVMALAGSDNEAEALHALRTAHRLLAAGGMDFVALADRIAGKAPGGVDAEALEDAVFDLRNEVRHLRAENEQLRRGGVVPAAQPAAPMAGFSESARDAAQIIRLQAELAALADALDQERAAAQRQASVQATLHQQMQEALAEAGKLAARLSDQETRRMRLEAENRRLSNDLHAVRIDLAEAQAQAQAPLQAPVYPQPVPMLAETAPPAAADRAAARRADKSRRKGGQGQYALL